MAIKRVVVLIEMDNGSQDMLFVEDPQNVDIQTSGTLQARYQSGSTLELVQDVDIHLGHCKIKHISKEKRHGIC